MPQWHGANLYNLPTKNVDKQKNKLQKFLTTFFFARHFLKNADKTPDIPTRCDKMKNVGG